MWYTSLIPTLRKQKQENFWVWCQARLQRDFQDSQGSTEKPYLKYQTNTQRRKIAKQQQIRQKKKNLRILIPTFYLEVNFYLFVSCFGYNFCVCFSVYVYIFMVKCENNGNVVYNYLIPSGGFTYACTLFTDRNTELPQIGEYFRVLRKIKGVNTSRHGSGS